MTLKRLREHLPWRVRRTLNVAYYVRHLTQFVFRSVDKTPPLEADVHSRLDVLSLLDHSNVNNYLLAIKSLLLHLPTRPALTVLSDGSLQPYDIEKLRRHILGIRVLSKDQIPVPSSSEAIFARWCQEYPYLAKLIYLPLTTEAPFLMILDSDVIFRAPLPADFGQLPPDVDAQYNCDHDHSQFDPCFNYVDEYAKPRGLRLIKNLNCGLMIWRRSALRPLDAVQFLNYVVQRHGFLHAVAEQDAWTVLASQLRTEPLPPQFLVLSNWQYNTRTYRRQALAIHYVSGERYRRLDYLRDGWRIIKLLRSNSRSTPMGFFSEER